MGEVLGIDLGTTNTVVAGQLHGEVTALAEPGGETLLPSVVSFHPNGSILVGLPAKERRLLDPRNTVYSIKRLLGRRWDSKEVRQARTRLPFDLREGAGQAPVVAVRSGTYTLPEISAFVLRKARKVAEAALGAPAERAVVTVPANFNDLQRAATKIAGRVAGLEILRIINEPTAAALAYGYGQRRANRLAVYDLGGGTFDITLLDLAGNQFEVLGTAGNTFLGGDDFDRAIAERIAEAFLQAHRYDLRANHDSYARLRVAAETVKILLSEQRALSLPLPELAEGAMGRPVDFTFDFTRDELEETCADIVDQSLKVCREALAVARMRSSDFDEVLLVGGSTRIPFVRQRVAEFFGREPIWHINPEEVVAIGAGLQAIEMTRAQNRRSVPPTPPSQRKASAPPPGTPFPLSGPEQPEDLMDADDMEEPTRIHPRSLLSTRPPPPSQRPPAPPQAPAQGSHTSSGVGPPGPGPAGAQRGAPGMTATEAALRARIAEENARFEKELPSPGSDYPTDADPRPVAADSLPAFGLPTVETEQGRLPQVSAPPGLPLIGKTMLGLGTAPSPSEPHTLGADHPLPPWAGNHADAGDGRTGTTSEGAAAQNPLTQSGPPPALDVESLPLPSVPSSAPPPERAAAAAAPANAVGFPLTSVVSAQISEVLQQSPAPVPGSGPSGAASTPVVLTGASAVAPPAAVAAAGAPKLVDVTPLSLVVETVGGFCDAIIRRNTPVPCEQSRVFVTAVDGQTAVRVRVGQGVSTSFADNTLLGEVLLDALQPAPRGHVQVEVTFSLNTDGMLSVRAVDVATQRATTARLRLEGLPDAAEIARLQQRHAALPTM